MQQASLLLCHRMVTQNQRQDQEKHPSGRTPTQLGANMLMHLMLNLVSSAIFLLAECNLLLRPLPRKFLFKR